MSKYLIAASIFGWMLQSEAAGQKPGNLDKEPTATVRVLAFEAKGRFLGPANVRIFESSEHRNLAGRFRGGVATGIPFGTYRIEGILPWYFSDIRYIRVYQTSVTVVMGLRFAEELPQIPPGLTGRVFGLSVPADKSFVKLIGVYENVSIESAIDNDGRFSLGGLSRGLFLLLVVGENGILASRTLTVPYTGPPLRIEVGTDHSIAAEK